LITGGAGNLACQLTWKLSRQFENIVLFDVAPAPIGKVDPATTFEQGDLLNSSQIEKLFHQHQPSAVIHLASLLSGSCEQDRARAWQVNMDGTFALFEAALRYNRPTVLFASSIAAFGGHLPEVLTDETPQWPDGLYGVTKMAAERLGTYYHARHGLDFRCLRLPITISRHAPAGAASALASHAFIEAAKNGSFTFHSRPDTKLALIYIGDVLRAFTLLLAAPNSSLTRRVYNIAAMTATPRQIADVILRHLPHSLVQFAPKEAIATLLESWPGAIDDQAARRDWNWNPEFDLERTGADFISQLQLEFPQPVTDGQRL
jgi:threonine 3-dehydrogenase